MGRACRSRCRSRDRSCSRVLVDERTNSGWVGGFVAHVPMKLNRKSTLSLIFVMAGRTSSCRQALASGHLDMMCASRETVDLVSETLPEV
jgi:hypothetical protein